MIHRLTFQVWKQSMQSRMFLEGAFTFILTLVFQVFVSKYLNSVHDIQKDLATGELSTEELASQLDGALRFLNISIYISSI